MVRAERCMAELRSELPEHVWDGRRLPVPVERIADSYFGLRVLEVSLDQMCSVAGCPELAEGQSLSGLLLVDRREIWVNAEEAAQSEGRRRFTIGHELGHWIMHRRAHSSLFCRSAGVDPETDAEEAEDVPDIEEEASVFAANLLMPEDLMRERWRKVANHAAMCRIFVASKQAMGRRLHQAIPRSG